MSKKKLDTAGVMNELHGQSAFFPSKQKQQEPENKEISPSPLDLQKSNQTDAVIPRYHDTTASRNHEAMKPSLAREDDLIEKARKAVRQVGKEAATHRFTIEEKNMLADIEYSYRRLGIRTSENEITRIAINYFAEDYRKNGEQSLLAKVLKLLNS